ncbi:MAG: translocation/assembly module TamB domain-containing protein [Gemmatimonadales bacterium]
MRRGRLLARVGIGLLALPLLLLVVISLPPVTRMIGRRLLPKINEQLNGRLDVADLSGSLLGRLELHGVTLRDPAGDPVLQAERVELDYGLRDLLRGRISLGPILLVRPVVRLVKEHPGEPYSILQIFATGDDEKRETGNVDITVRSLELRDGTLFATVWRQPADPQLETAQQLDTVRLESVNLRLPLLHYSAGPTLPRTAIAEITSARAWLVHADLELLELAGTANLRGDSLDVALETVRLPHSRFSATAWLLTRGDRRRFAAAADVEQLTAADIDGLITGATIPADWTFAGTVRAVSPGSEGGALTVSSRDLRIGAAGGTLTGAVTVIGDDTEWMAEDSRIVVQGVQVAELLRPFGVRSTLRARVDGVLTADGREGTADLGVAGLRGYGVASAATGRIQASGARDSMRIAARLAGSFGRTTFSGTLQTDGRLSLRRVVADVAALDLAALDQRLPPSWLNARLEGDVRFGSLPQEGTLRLWLDSSTIRGAPIDTAAIIAHAAGGLLTADSILLHTSGVRVTGAGTFGLQEDQTGDLTLSLDAPALDAVEPLVRALTGDSVRGLAGALRLGVTASGSLSRYTLALDAEGQDIAVGGGLEIRALEAAAGGAPDSLTWSVRAALDDDAQTAVRAAGTMAKATMALDALALERNDATWTLDDDAVVERRDGRIVLDRAVLRRASGFGEITVSGSHPGALTLRADRVPLGDIVGDVVADSLPEVNGEAIYADGRLRGEVSLAGAAGHPLRLELATRPLRAQLVAQDFDLLQIAPLIPGVRDLEGRLDGSVSVSGSVDAPRLDGELALAAGALTLPSTGVRYRSVQGRFTFAGDALRIDTLHVTAGPGDARLTGDVTFTRLDHPELDLTLQARSFAVMSRRDFLEAVATADLRLTGSPSGARLTGRATVNEGAAYVERFLRASGIDLSNPLYAQFVDTTVLARERLAPGAIERFVDSLTVDSVSVNLGDDFWLRSPDASIQLAGRLTVSSGSETGETANAAAERYRLMGTVRTVRGIYRMALAPGVTREFLVREGSLRFVGERYGDAILDMAVDHELRTARGEAITITARITGTIGTPVVTLSSDVTPRLSETEIISYLVFGAPTVQAFLGDEPEAAERRSVFEQSAQRLAGVLSGRIETAVQDQLGLPIDYFRIKPGEVQSGLAGTELVLGMQVRILGQPSFLRASPRFCPRERLLSLDQIGINLETRISPEWGVALSVDPVQGCEAVMAGTTRPYQFGADVFWERR